MTTASTALREMIAAPGLLRLPGVFDGISAHLARRAGFRAVYATGAGIAASGFGLPDIGLVTATERRRSPRRTGARGEGSPVLPVLGQRSCTRWK